MAKHCLELYLALAAEVIRGNYKVYEIVCTDQPTTVEEASLTYYLAAKEFDYADIVSDGAGKLTIPVAEGIEIEETGTATHIALVRENPADTFELVAVTTCEEEELTTGGLVTIPPWEIILGQPT